VEARVRRPGPAIRRRAQQIQTRGFRAAKPSGRNRRRADGRRVGAPVAGILCRAAMSLLYRNCGGLLLAAAHAFYMFVDKASQTFPEFNPGIVKVISRRLRPAGPEHIRNPRSGSMAKAALTCLLLLLFVHTASFISTVKILFSSRAREGDNV